MKMTCKPRYGKTNDLVRKIHSVRGLQNLIKQSSKYTSNMTKGKLTNRNGDMNIEGEVLEPNYRGIKRQTKSLLINNKELNPFFRYFSQNNLFCLFFFLTCAL